MQQNQVTMKEKIAFACRLNMTSNRGIPIAAEKKDSYVKKVSLYLKRCQQNINPETVIVVYVCTQVHNFPDKLYKDTQILLLFVVDAQ